MAVTSGFFNSLYGDRKYNAEQFSSMFNNLITDGVFSNVGNAFQVTADGSNVLIDVGRAWFNSVWVYNDTLYPLPVQPSEVLLDRIDAVVIEINHTEAIRAGRIFFVQGTASADPQRPVLTNTEDIHQYPLAYVYRTAGASTVTQADITNMIGTSSCPYVTGILATQDIDKVVAQWEAQFNQWFEDLQIELSGDVAANLASQIIEIDARFEELAKTGCVYEDLQDSNNDTILDSQSRVIEGSTSFRQRSEDSPSGTGTSGDVNNLKMEIVKLNNKVNVIDYFRIGDIRTSVKDDLGDQYLLCNGAQVPRTNYPELSEVRPFLPYGAWNISNIYAAFSSEYEDIEVVKTIYANGYYVAIVNAQSRSDPDTHIAAIAYATDFYGTWSKKIVLTSNHGNGFSGETRFNDLMFGGNYFVAVGCRFNDSSEKKDPYICWASTPSGTWPGKSIGWGEVTDPPWGENTLQAVGYYGGRFIVAGCHKPDNSNSTRLTVKVAWSTTLSGAFTNKTLWTTANGWTSGAVTGIAYVNSRYVVVGYTTRSSASSYDVPYYAKVAVVNGDPNGSWSVRNMAENAAIESVTIGKNNEIVVGGRHNLSASVGGSDHSNPFIAWSENYGSSWTTKQINDDENDGVVSIIYSAIDDIYIGIIEDSIIYSKDIKNNPITTKVISEVSSSTNMRMSITLSSNRFYLLSAGTNAHIKDNTYLDIPMIPSIDSYGDVTRSFIKIKE